MSDQSQFDFQWEPRARLCDKCLPFCDALLYAETDIVDDDSGFKYSIWDIQGASRGSCEICARIWLALPSDYDPYAVSAYALQWHVPVVRIDALKWDWDSCWTLEFRYLEAPSGWEPDSIPPGPASYIRPDLEVCFWPYFKELEQPFVACETLDYAYLVMIGLFKVWLEADRRRHIHDGYAATSSTPRSQTSIAFLPSRLLHISSDGTFVQLVTRNALSASTRYAALSHRWCDGAFFKCTTTTIQLLWLGIAVQALTKTFQEAVRVVKDLGLNYVWIDSLCIVQDDKNDWNREAHTMSSVYLHADIIIAANTDSRDPGASFIEPVLSSVMNASRTNSLGMSLSRASIGIWNCPLNERAWCFQERLLGKRIYHFCLDDAVFETKPESLRPNLPSLRFPGGEYGSSWRIHQGSPGSEAEPREVVLNWLKVPEGLLEGGKPTTLPTEQQLGEWFELICDYMRKEITFPRDRLVAFDAIASRWASFFGWTYVCGLWEEALPLCLLWTVLTPELSSRIQPGPSTFQAVHIPSWSWAAMCRDTFNPWCLFISYRCANRDSSRLRDIMNASLQPLFTAEYILRAGMHTLHMYGELLPVCSVDHVGGQETVLIRVRNPFQQRHLLTLVLSPDRLPPPSPRLSTASSDENLWVLPVCADILEYNRDLMFYALVICAKGAGNEYIRVGVAGTHDEYHQHRALNVEQGTGASWARKEQIQSYSKRVQQGSLHNGRSFFLI